MIWVIFMLLAVWFVGVATSSKIIFRLMMKDGQRISQNTESDVIFYACMALILAFMLGPLFWVGWHIYTFLRPFMLAAAKAYLEKTR